MSLVASGQGHARRQGRAEVVHTVTSLAAKIALDRRHHRVRAVIEQDSALKEYRD